MSAMVIAALRPIDELRRAMRHASSDSASTKPPPRACAQYVRQPQRFGDDEEHGADRDRRLGKPRRHPRQGDQVVAEHDQHLTP